MLLRNDGVGGSTPLGGSILRFRRKLRMASHPCHSSSGKTHSPFASCGSFGWQAIVATAVRGKLTHPSLPEEASDGKPSLPQQFGENSLTLRFLRKLRMASHPCHSSSGKTHSPFASGGSFGWQAIVDCSCGRVAGAYFALAFIAQLLSQFCVSSKVSRFCRCNILISTLDVQHNRTST